MSHPDEGVLQELLDGELPPADAEAVRAHLSGCVPCAVVLRDLAAIQAESDAIVARLPLDPPIVRPAQKARRPMNLRAIGLAASVALVAGTSWVLLRSNPRNFATRDDSAAGLALPMPSEERQEVPATTPAAPPAPSATVRADANTERGQAKQVPRKADAAGEAHREVDAPAPQFTAKDLASEAQPQPEQEEKKKEAVDETRRANGAIPAGAPAPMAQMAPSPGAASRRTLGAAGAPGTVTTVADAEARFGKPLRTITGLTPESVEMVGQGSLGQVRQRYLVNGTAVTLTQEWLRDSVTYDSKAFESTSRMREEQAAGHVRTWVSGGIFLQLEAALPADSLDALVKRVK